MPVNLCWIKIIIFPAKGKYIPNLFSETFQEEKHGAEAADKQSFFSCV